MKILAALSGGVDSAVAAYLATQAGHEVTAVHMALTRGNDRVSAGGCCTIEDMQDAKRSAAIIGIPFYVWDLSEEFQKTVIQDFLDQYKLGNTPNPCIRCNEFVKFKVLMEKGIELGFDAVLTGHYANISSDENGINYLSRAVNPQKDQSYVLSSIGQNALQKLHLELGNFRTKNEVREIAQKAGLPVSHKAESYDICFIEKGQTKEFLKQNLQTKPGKVLDSAGNFLGEHNGAELYTIGSRRGLDLKNPKGDGIPLFVTNKNMIKNELIVGPKSDLLVETINCQEAIWYKNAESKLNSANSRLFCQYRAHGEPYPIEILSHSQTQFEVKSIGEKFSAVASGQTLALYCDETVIGAGIIQ